MTLREVPMFRVECDDKSCDASPQDDSEFYAWVEASQASDEAQIAGWYVGEFGELCEEHAPRCVCGAIIRDDEDAALDGLCEDCSDATPGDAA
jgi:hypothetical protein